MATPIFEQVEFQIKADFSDVEDRMLSTERAAHRISEGIREAFTKLETFASQGATSISRQAQIMREKSVSDFKMSTQDFSFWLSEVTSGVRGFINEIRKGFVNTVAETTDMIKRTTVEPFAENIVKPFNRIFLLPIKEKFLDFHDFVSDTTSIIGIEIQEFFSDIGKGVDKVLGPAKPVLEGLFLGTKVLVEGIKVGLFSLPAIISKAVGVTRDFVQFFKQGFTLVRDYIGGSILLMRNFIGETIDAGKAAIHTAAKYSGILYLAKGIQKASTFAMKVTGVSIAIAGITDLFNEITGKSSTAFGTLFDFIGAAFEPLNVALVRLAETLGPIIFDMLDPFISLLASFVDEISRALSAATQEGGALVGVFQSLFQAIGIVVSALFDIMKTFLTEFVPKLMPLITAIVDQVVKLVMMIAPVLVKLAEKLFPALAKLIEGLMPAVISLVEAFAEVIIALVDAIAEELNPLVDLIVDLVKDLVPLLVDLIKSTIPLIKALIPILVFVVKVLAVVIGKLVAPIVVKTVSFLIKSLGVLVGIIVDLVSAIGAFGSAIKSGIMGALNFVIDGFIGFFNLVERGFNGLLELVKSFWKGFKKYSGVDLATSLSNTLIGSFSGFFEGIKEFMKGAVNMIIEGFNAIAFYELPFLGTSYGSLLGLSKIPKFEEGAVITGPVIGEVGEGRYPELILPLDNQSIEKVAPSLGMMGFPKEIGVMGMKEMMQAVGDIRDILLRAMERSRGVGGSESVSPANPTFSRTGSVSMSMKGLVR